MSPVSVSQRAINLHENQGEFPSAIFDDRSSELRVELLVGGLNGHPNLKKIWSQLRDDEWNPRLMGK